MEYTDYRAMNGIMVLYHFKGFSSDTQVSKYEMDNGLSDTDFEIK